MSRLAVAASPIRSMHLVALVATVALVTAVGALTVAVPAPAADAAEAAWGHASAPTQKIKPGCRDYRFHYDVTVPGDEWMAEITLVDPRGGKVSTRTYESSTYASSGAGTFRLCKPTTRPGRYRIDMLVTSYDDRAVSARHVAPSTFRLVARRR